MKLRVLSNAIFATGLFSMAFVTACSRRNQNSLSVGRPQNVQKAPSHMVHTRWRGKTPNDSFVIDNWDWQRRQPGLTVYYEISQLKTNTKIEIIETTASLANAPRITKLTRLPSFIRADQKAPNLVLNGPLHLNSVLRWLYRKHFFQTYRCRSSIYWPTVNRLTPAKLGDLFIYRPAAFPINTHHIDFLTGLEVNVHSLKIVGLAAVQSPSPEPGDRKIYVGGYTHRDVLLGGNLKGALGFDGFEFACQAEYLSIGNRPNIFEYLPWYDRSADKSFSQGADWYLGSKYSPAVDERNSESDFAVKDIGALEAQTMVVDTSDSYFQKIQKEEKGRD